MRRISYPPLIILLDLLFIFLFISAIKDESKVSITFEGDMPEDIVIVSSITNQVIRGDRPTGFYIKWDCDTHSDCDIFRSTYGNMISFVLPDDLYSEISKMSISALMFNHCNKIDFVIINKNNRASINYGRLKNDNICLKEINGFDVWVNKVKL